MEKNIFENAKFGKKFVTRDGRIALYIEAYDINNVSLIELITIDRILITVSKDSGFVDYENNISQNDDIISPYQEPIDEKELDELANKYVEGGWNHMDMASRRDFKAGYRQRAMEE